MNKKIAILTLTGYFNFGNRLQNYALQEYLSSLGFIVDTIRINGAIFSKKPNEDKKNVLTIIKKIKNKPIKELLNILMQKTWGKYQDNKIEHFNEIRTKNFKDFSKEYINETDFYISEKNLPEDLDEQYDYFIVGSDQVWNPHFNLYNRSIYFLNFAPQQKRVTYAPSFGIPELPEKYIAEYKRGLLSFNKLSCREISGALLIKNLINKDAEILIDPTMLLDREEWLKIAKEPKKKFNNPCILTYFLGKIEKKDRELIKNVAKENRLTVINLTSIRDKENYTIGPGEFINYVDSSSIIFTDSFHGAIFAILFEKPFIVCQSINDSRRSMETRFDTLLSIFKLDSRKFSNIKNTKDIFNIDFSHVPLILDRERQKANQYIRNILQIKQ